MVEVPNVLPLTSSRASVRWARIGGTVQHTRGDPLAHLKATVRTKQPTTGTAVRREPGSHLLPSNIFNIHDFLVSHFRLWHYATKTRARFTGPSRTGALQRRCRAFPYHAVRSTSTSYVPAVFPFTADLQAALGLPHSRGILAGSATNQEKVIPSPYAGEPLR